MEVVEEGQLSGRTAMTDGESWLRRRQLCHIGSNKNPHGVLRSLDRLGFRWKSRGQGQAGGTRDGGATVDVPWRLSALCSQQEARQTAWSVARESGWWHFRDCGAAAHGETWRLLPVVVILMAADVYSSTCFVPGAILKGFMWLVYPGARFQSLTASSHANKVIGLCFYD